MARSARRRNPSRRGGPIGFGMTLTPGRHLPLTAMSRGEGFDRLMYEGNGHVPVGASAEHPGP